VSKAGDSKRERSCIVSRETAPAEAMIRFVADPQAQIIADLKGNLPGRGAWVLGRRELVEQAIKRQAFARALKMPVKAPPDLADKVDKLLVRAGLANLSLARRSGAVITGAGKIDNAVRSGTPELFCLIHANEAAADGRRKLAQAVFSAQKARGSGQDAAGADKSIKILAPFTAEELQFAFGGHNVMHIAIAENRGAASFIKALRRLMAYRGEPL